MAGNPPKSDEWRALFQGWPESLARKGIVVNSLNEAMPFKGFMIRGDMLLLERANPDSLGARYILLQFDSIAAVKLTDALNSAAFTPLGFAGRLSNG